jgi:hypothetical protein
LTNTLLACRYVVLRIMLYRIYRARSITFESGSVLMISAAMNLLTNLLHEIKGGYIDPSAARFWLRLALALTALFGGVAIFIVGRNVAVVEQYDRSRLLGGSPRPRLENAEEIHKAFEDHLICVPWVVWLFAVGGLFFFADLALMILSFFGMP